MTAEMGRNGAHAIWTQNKIGVALALYWSKKGYTYPQSPTSQSPCTARREWHGLHLHASAIWLLCTLPPGQMHKQHKYRFWRSLLWT